MPHPHPFLVFFRCDCDMVSAIFRVVKIPPTQNVAETMSQLHHEKWRGGGGKKYLQTWRKKKTSRWENPIPNSLSVKNKLIPCRVLFCSKSVWSFFSLTLWVALITRISFYLSFVEIEKSMSDKSFQFSRAWALEGSFSIFFSQMLVFFAKMTVIFCLKRWSPWETDKLNFFWRMFHMFFYILNVIKA